MDGTPSKSGGGGGPAPFLLKTYDMVNDSATDEIVSWSSNKKSFVVWNPPEFARLLLPTYFKHNNFSSFIRQLNTYGFRKIDPERWEFANEDFVKGQKHLLKNIHRRKPIHCHSNPQGSSTVDPERAAFEEEIKLSREKIALEKSVSRFKHQQPATKLQLEDLTRRVYSMERRQDNLLALLNKAVQNPEFVDHLARKLESMDFSVYNKKLRFCQDDNSRMVPEVGFVDNHSPFTSDFGNVFHQGFTNKLRLELLSAISDVNLVSHKENRGEPGAGIRNIQATPGGLPLTEQPELSDTGASFTFNLIGYPSLKDDKEAKGSISCQLNLGLASSMSQVKTTQNTDRMPQLIEEINKTSEWMYNGKHSKSDFKIPQRNRSENSSLHDPPAHSQAPANDVFWEQFLTERPGSTTSENGDSPNMQKFKGSNPNP